MAHSTSESDIRVERVENFLNLVSITSLHRANCSDD